MPSFADPGLALCIGGHLGWHCSDDCTIWGPYLPAGCKCLCLLMVGHVVLKAGVNLGKAASCFHPFFFFLLNKSLQRFPWSSDDTSSKGFEYRKHIFDYYHDVCRVIR